MPCTYYTPEEEMAIARKEWKEKLDQVTRLLCEVMRSAKWDDLEGQWNLEGTASDELTDWWEEHQEMDRQRETAERRAKEAEVKQLEKQKKELEKRLESAKKKLKK